eukprot:COSAG01_NODE_88_length_27337_cov_22.941699_24_plen_133_part_00
MNTRQSVTEQRTAQLTTSTDAARVMMTTAMLVRNAPAQLIADAVYVRVDTAQSVAAHMSAQHPSLSRRRRRPGLSSQQHGTTAQRAAHPQPHPQPQPHLIPTTLPKACAGVSILTFVIRTGVTQANLSQNGF